MFFLTYTSLNGNIHFVSSCIQSYNIIFSVCLCVCDKLVKISKPVAVILMQRFAFSTTSRQADNIKISDQSDQHLVCSLY
ncbi:hypothetical protein O3M35_010423 [Rhynocoris fuscipes]|uniref:Uncharacterized protein n=1 Tax=Rhynocoris fuscipes TaxID=488301 RepID=A0AAW1D488_9HEMI